jgi:1-aminocyclopropane-1-carboxylate deaminase/D-cysteine desulfhydrase-like pyridoxal-dependent ACC family enzyme
MRLTPVERYKVKGRVIYVKREDLACKPPGPPFAKVRGLYPVLKKFKAEGINTVGYMETSVSMAGWGISYFCKKLNMKAVIFKPEYKDGHKHNQDAQTAVWRKLGAEVIPLIRPTQLAVNFYRARSILENKYAGAIMLPQGLPFKETRLEVAKQVKNVKDALGSNITVISSVGSGTMVAGIMLGALKYEMSGELYGVLVSRKDPGKMRRGIIQAVMSTQVVANYKIQYYYPDGLLSRLRRTFNLNIHDAGYGYTQEEDCKCPFPCNTYYDRKAYKWMLDNIKQFKKPILFWNIGA